MERTIPVFGFHGRGILESALHRTGASHEKARHLRAGLE